MMKAPLLSVLQQILNINFSWILFQKVIYLWIGRNCNPTFLTQVLGVPNYAAVPDNLVRKDFLYLLGSRLLPFTHSIFPPTNNTICLLSVQVASSPLIMRNYLLTVFAPRAGHCRVAENQSFHWLAEGSEAILPLPTCHQVGNRTHPVWEHREATVWGVLNYPTSAGIFFKLTQKSGLLLKTRCSLKSLQVQT